MKINIKKLSKISALIIATGITLCKDNHQIDYLYEYKDMKIENVQNQKNTEIILKLLDENNNLSLEDKNFLKSYVDYYNERSPYFNMNTVIPALKNLNINYTGQTNKLTLGSFDIETYEIVINNYTNFNQEIKDVLFHEFIHALTINKGMTSTNKYLYEGITEQENIEYNDVAEPNYKILRDYIDELKNLVGEEIILDYFYSGNQNLLINELAKIKSGKKDAKLLLESMYKHYFYGTKCYSSGQDQAKETAEDLLQEYNKVLTKSK